MKIKRVQKKGDFEYQDPLSQETLSKDTLLSRILTPTTEAKTKTTSLDEPSPPPSLMDELKAILPSH